MSPTPEPYGARGNHFVDFVRSDAVPGDMFDIGLSPDDLCDPHACGSLATKVCLSMRRKGYKDLIGVGAVRIDSQRIWMVTPITARNLGARLLLPLIPWGMRLEVEREG